MHIFLKYLNLANKKSKVDIFYRGLTEYLYNIDIPYGVQINNKLSCINFKNNRLSKGKNKKQYLSPAP